MADLEVIGIKELRAAIARNPGTVLDETRTFLTRGLAKYKSGIINSPWRMGSSGGGAPVSNDTRYKRSNQKSRSGNLRDSHTTIISKLEGSIGPNLSVAPYAPYVHGLKGYPRKRKYQLRPWLDYVKRNQDGAIQTLYRTFLKNIVSDLAK